LRLDSATVFNKIRDSIVNVKIGNDTIKILKQEYAPATTSVLTWTITPKFPIQLKAYILVFRNGQLLLNDQYNLSDTNKITIVSTSFKIGANYTVATVSGIGSIGTGVFPNPVYPEAGIAVSTGTTWTTSITNNSSNWNTAFTDRLKWDGGSTGLTASTGRGSLGGTTIGQSMFTLTNPSSITFPRFNANNSVSSLTASEFRTAIGAGTGTVTSVIVGSGTPLSINNNTTVPEISMAAASGSVNGYLSSTDWTTFNGKQNALGNASGSVNGILTSTDWTTFNNKGSGNISGNGSNLYFPIFTSSAYIGQSLLRYDGSSIPNAKLISDYNFNEFNGALSATGSTTLSNLAGTGTRMVVTSSTGLLSTQAIGVTSFSAGTTGLTPSTSTSGDVTLNGTLALLNGGTGATTASSARTALGATVRGANVFTLADISAISFLRYNADNTVTQRGADGMLSDLGGTTIGQSMFTLTNPSAITFPRFNANNTVSALSASDFRTAIGVSVGGGTVTEVTGTLPILVTNGTTTPAITIANASTSAAGVVTTGTQSFVGSKTFTGLVGFQRAIQRPYESVTVSSASITTSSSWVVVNNAGTVTLTFPSASSSTGTEFHIKTITNNSVISASSNIAPLAGGSASTAILSATAGKWATLVSDGTNWVIMQAN
jgi:hypothetical protein